MNPPNRPDLDAHVLSIVNDRRFAAFAADQGIPESEIDDALQEAAIAVWKLAKREEPFGEPLVTTTAHRAILKYARKLQRVPVPSGTPGETVAAAGDEPVQEPLFDLTAVEILALHGKGQLVEHSRGWTYSLGGVRHALGAGLSHEEAARKAITIIIGGAA